MTRNRDYNAAIKGLRIMNERKQARGGWRSKIETTPGSRWGNLTAVEPGPSYISPNTGAVRERWVYQCECGVRVCWQPSTVRSNVKVHGWCSCGDCFRVEQERLAKAVGE